MKTLTIKSCTKCPYYVQMGFSAPLYCCKKEQVINVLDTIPDWCPLPDYKEVANENADD